MPAVIQTLSIAIKELREWFHRPWQAVTLILGPLALLIIFGTGSDPTANPPRAIVVVPPGQGAARLLENYRKTFE